MKKRITTLIFDFDGLILDTETADYESWREVYNSYGCALSLAEWSVCIGSADTFDPYALLEERLGRPIDRTGIRRQRRSRFARLMEGRTTLPGVSAFLTRARELDLKVGIASSSTRSWVLGYLTQLGLHTYFDQTVCSDDVERTKPDPALFLTALRRLKSEPQEAIVFEDSPNGVLAAKRAGIFCVVVPNQMTASLDLSMADLRVLSLHETSLDSLLASTAACNRPGA